MSAEWKVVVRVVSATGEHEPYEETYNDVLPDAVLMTILAGKFDLVVAGMRVWGGKPSIDFKARRLYLNGESFNDTPNARTS